MKKRITIELDQNQVELLGEALDERHLQRMNAAADAFARKDLAASKALTDEADELTELMRLVAVAWRGE